MIGEDTPRNQLPCRRYDLQQAAGDLEIAERLGGLPSEIVVLVVQNRFPGGPARRKRHDHIMPAPVFPGTLCASRRAPEFPISARFPLDLAMQRLCSDLPNSTWLPGKE